MEDQINRDLAIFHQVCEVNELNPEAVSAEAHLRFPAKFKDGENAERLIWTALDHRACALMSSVAPGTDETKKLRNHQAAYTIDGDPAAPSFIINEEAIRSQYSADKATAIIEALGHVHLPVTG